MASTKTVRRTVYGWLGIGLAAGVMAAGAAVGAHAAPAAGASTAQVPGRAGSDSLLNRSGARSVSVVTVSHSIPAVQFPADETAPVRSTDPKVVRQVAGLLDALTPPRGGVMPCPNDRGTSVVIDLPDTARAEANPDGCGYVVLTVPGRPSQIMSGARELIPRVYALLGVTWQNGSPPSEPAPSRSS